MNVILEGTSQYIIFRLIGYANYPPCSFYDLLINYTIHFSYLDRAEHLVKHM